MDMTRASATEIAAAIRAGELTSVDVVSALAERITAREPEIHAFAHFDASQALTEARLRDASAPTGALHGVPVAIKDIIDTSDMPTEMGSPIYAGNQSRGDAAPVALLRKAGAVILGKTVTAEFASQAPGATRNPHNTAHTPGGSSSGSAAAVADFMVPLALGTQTGGSVLRPSSYCGIVGFKPTFGAFNLTGVKPAGQSLDTLGIHARSLGDVALCACGLLGGQGWHTSALQAAPKIGLCRTPLWEHASPDTRTAVEDAATRLAAAGAEIEEIDLPAPFSRLNAARMKIQGFERAHALTWEWNHHRDLLGEPLRDEIARGLEVSPADYVEAVRHAKTCRALITDTLSAHDALLAPAADGPAPEGLASTGNARFQGFWTVLRPPTVTLPTHRAENGLPVGIQLIGRHHEEGALIALADWALNVLGPAS